MTSLTDETSYVTYSMSLAISCSMCDCAVFVIGFKYYDIFDHILSYKIVEMTIGSVDIMNSLLGYIKYSFCFDVMIHTCVDTMSLFGINTVSLSDSQMSALSVSSLVRCINPVLLP